MGYNRSLKNEAHKGTLFVVSTPIGNLEDITLRALRTLREVDLIAAEDTRHTRKLLSKYDIHTPMTSYYEQNRAAKGKKLLGDLKAGRNIALVSNAGTPGISDPGSHLIRIAVADGIPVVPVPGPDAVTTAVAISGLGDRGFTFVGFLPIRVTKRRELLETLTSRRQATVFFESPRRLVKVLECLAQICPQRSIVVLRELTKKHEDAVRGTTDEVLEHFRRNPCLGEVVVAVQGTSRESEPDWHSISVDEHVKMIMDRKGLPKGEAIKLAARERGIPKRVVYNEVVRSGS